MSIRDAFGMKNEKFKVVRAAEEINHESRAKIERKF
jgi:hypothetical protein